MMSFLSDWWEAFVISGRYEMGDPLAPSEVEGNRDREPWNRRKDVMTFSIEIVMARIF
jgi:hypothetical protein